MIFFEGDNSKKNILFILVSFFMLIIIFQYSRFNIFDNISNDKEVDLYWSELGQVVSKTSEDIENNFVVAETNIENLKYQTDREIKRAILLEKTKEFLEDKKNTSTTNSTSTE